LRIDSLRQNAERAKEAVKSERLKQQKDKLTKSQQKIQNIG
jgi:hypothetical protein